MENEKVANSSLGEHLRLLRVARGLSQDDVAVRMGLSVKSGRTTVSAIERDYASNPTVRIVSRYLRAIGHRWADVYHVLDRLEPLPDVSPELIAAAKRALPPEPSRSYQPSPDVKEPQVNASERKGNEGSSLSGEAEGDDRKYQIADSKCQIDQDSKSDEPEPQAVSPGDPSSLPSPQRGEGEEAKVPPPFVQPTGPLPPRKEYPKMTPELFKKLFPERNRHLEALEEAKKAAAKFQNGIAAPRSGAPLPPPVQNKSAEIYQDFQFQANIIRLKVRQLLADSKIPIIFNNGYVNFGLKVLGALRRAGKVTEPVAQEAAWSRSMDAAYAYAEKHLPDMEFADKVRQAVIEAHAELTKR
jgi:transcriptional regulator with XRE-family HTH domain